MHRDRFIRASNEKEPRNRRAPVAAAMAGVITLLAACAPSSSSGEGPVKEERSVVVEDDTLAETDQPVTVEHPDDSSEQLVDLSEIILHVREIIDSSADQETATQNVQDFFESYLYESDNDSEVSPELFAKRYADILHMVINISSVYAEEYFYKDFVQQGNDSNCEKVVEQLQPIINTVASAAAFGNQEVAAAGIRAAEENTRRGNIYRLLYDAHALPGDAPKDYAGWVELPNPNNTATDPLTVDYTILDNFYPAAQIIGNSNVQGIEDNFTLSFSMGPPVSVEFVEAA